MSAASTRALYAKARAGLASGDAGYWQAAEAMAELVAAGQSHRQIGAELNCSHITVSRYVSVWRGTQGSKGKRPTFAEAMAAVRGDRTAERLIPSTPARRADLAAELLRDREVYEAPAVVEAVREQVHTRHAERMAEGIHNPPPPPPTRTEVRHQRMLTTDASNAHFWRDLTWTSRKQAKTIRDAKAELGRSGLPRRDSGDLIKAMRELERAVVAFNEAVHEAGVGAPMHG